MRTVLRLVPALVLLAPGRAQVPPTQPSSTDPVLSALLRETLQGHPDFLKADAALLRDSCRVDAVDAVFAFGIGEDTGDGGVADARGIFCIVILLHKWYDGGSK